jgi:transposase InsO family protein
MVDLFSKYAEGIPLRNKEAITVARALFDVVISRYGIPLQLLSDNGREFENNVMLELCRLTGIDKIHTTAYRPSTNGAVERFHRTLNSMLGKVVAEHQRD